MGSFVWMFADQWVQRVDVKHMSLDHIWKSIQHIPTDFLIGGASFRSVCTYDLLDLTNLYRTECELAKDRPQFSFFFRMWVEVAWDLIVIRLAMLCRAYAVFLLRVLHVARQIFWPSCCPRPSVSWPFETAGESSNKYNELIVGTFIVYNHLEVVDRLEVWASWNWRVHSCAVHAKNTGQNGAKIHRM